MQKFLFSFPSCKKTFEISDDIFGLIIDTMDTEVVEKQRIKLIISELFMNAYLHGNDADPAKTIEVVFEFDTDRFVAEVRDSGRGITKEKFDQLANSGEDFESSSGRGMRIISRLCDSVDIFKDDKNRFCIKVVKKIKSRPVPATG